MSARASLPILVSLLLVSLASSAHAALHGRFVDASTGAPVAGVSLKLTSAADTANVKRLLAHDDGTFDVPGATLGAWKLEATRLGYAPLRTTVRAPNAAQDLGVLAMTPQAVNVRGITVTESPAPAVVRADTVEFRASAVKTHPDATAEDLVQKMPGVTVENGTVKAQGEQVQQVLVNGKPFFGSDPTAAMRNLPADEIDRIQVYDRMSDQAEFSGFDDGQSQKTMNFILRDRRAKFGKAYAGYGDRDRYQAGGNASLIHGATRVTAIGMSNNVGLQNFSPQDLIGASGGGGGGPRMMMMPGGPRPGGPGGGPPRGDRPGGGGLGGGFDPGNFLVGQQGGLTTTHSGGLNVAAQPSARLAITGSAFVNASDNDNTQSLLRTYVPPQDSTAAYDQRTVSDARNGNQRIDGRLEWTPDSSNSVIWAPRLYFQANRAHSDASAGYTSLADERTANTTSRTASETHADNLTQRLTLRHRFARRGRNVSADLSYGHSRRDGTRDQLSLTEYAGASAASDTLDQRTRSNSATNSFSARVAYTERLAEHWQAQLTWAPAVSKSDADARARGLDPLTGAYDVLDSAQSNTFASRTTTQNGGAALLWKQGAWRWLVSTSLQSQRLRSEQTYPIAGRVDQTFTDVLPSMQLNGNFANRRSLRLSLNSSTNVPSISQLQNVVDRSNPLALTAGNPRLREAASTSLMLRYGAADPMHSRSRFVFVNVTRTRHPISNATYSASSDTTIGGVALARGTQLTVPVNLDRSWSGNAFGVVSRPVAWLKSIVSLDGGGSWSRTPTRIRAGDNVTSTWAIRSGAVFASNVSPNLDFMLGWHGSYNLSRSTLATSTTGDYYAHTIDFRFNGIAPHGIVVREEVSHNLQDVSGAYGRDVVIWNTTLGKKFLKGNRGELRVTLSDALDQDRNVSRTITETYVQDSRDRTLGRYAQAVFTYTFR